MPRAPAEHRRGWDQGQGWSWVQPARHGQCCPRVLPSLGWTLTAPGDISVGKSQEEKRRKRERGGDEERSSRRGGGEEERGRGKEHRAAAASRSTGQQLPPAPSQLTAVKGHLWDSDHKPGWFGQAQPRPTLAGFYMS